MKFRADTFILLLMNNSQIIAQMIKHQERIQGYDVARALAVFIMIIVHFNLVLAKANNDESVLASILNLIQGKGAALFVVIAGAGISLMIRTNLFFNDLLRLREKRMLLFKRAAFLFLFGLIFSLVWPADILHSYGCYILIGAIVMTRHSAYLWVFILLLIFSYPFIIEVVDYEKGWDWLTIEYTDYWSFNGFIRNFFINGFNPVVPWVAFILAGIWLGRQNIHSKSIRNTILGVSITVFVLTQMLSKRLIEASQSFTNLTLDEALAFYGTAPMPPMPVFMISSISWAFMVITLCIWITEKLKHTTMFVFLVKTGQMAFTHYISHIVIGLIICITIYGENNLPLWYAITLALVYCFFCILFSVLWNKKYKKGPLSMFIRYVTKT
ncbi:DUF418 domain-containing protein [Seonamhaeicola marinus]|uniref:DUF1624 domain-containing protein n=1 Tax=Seonamhaeicola marinus TaxID=1912246 RepID=A0A5D0HRE3_9FLAO|nr:heparan-alpha-glucosaminide N-acetyltransferase domain-containing protein [Seonamhaeicola marinus]TYA71952.1 DUF1624 domain-containing protein [Seonamhaeicola marinus]